ncbi:ribonuclease P [Exophiala viscosa]|uniref:Ribonuclease P n=1 Tax=Exophiala viscosa TaxID=2486360 RepID=A0AAN6IED4_9EURO|nr:ribonuclease P [Exophiala viscosa]
MASSTQPAGQKRKVAFDRPAQSSQARKRQKHQDARAIPIQRANAALPANGELNVASFIKAREFEIGALEGSIQKSRKALTTRAFQQVPRQLRRRTASHNAKKVPRRLRRRAEREMRDDNTPTVTKRTRTPSRKLRLRLGTANLIKQLNQKRKTVRQKKKEAKANEKQTDPENHVSISKVPRLRKNTLAEPPKATVKYKRRQVNKTWMPTHLWHTKLAHMTRPTEPLWRIAIPLSPTEKSYRPSHRAAGSHGCIAWDTSYMSTVACRGTEAALESMLKALSFFPHGLNPAMHKKWKAGTRFAEAWVYERDNAKQAIAPVKIIWCIQSKTELSTAATARGDDQMDVDGNNQPPVASTKRKAKLDHQILFRIHPSAFHQFWQELLKVAKMQRPQVLLEDLRFELGSIDVQGPGSTESLLGILRPLMSEGGEADTTVCTWMCLAGLNNPGGVPLNAMLALDVMDPRLNHPPKQVKFPSADNSRLDEILVSWPPDKEPSSSRLLSHKERWLVSNSLPSQKAINRRRALAPPGQTPNISAKDPKIPVLLMASRSEVSKTAKSANAQGTWTVLLPWTCVDPMWRSLMYYPLSSGGTPRFGGLKQTQQLAFEHGTPWFPGDFPGTEAGKAWERTEGERRFDEWVRRPPKNRIAWDKLDLGMGRCGEVGRGWACDWECLFDSTKETSNNGVIAPPENAKKGTAEKVAPLLTQRQRKVAKAKAEASAQDEDTGRRRNTSSPESDPGEDRITAPPEVQYAQLPPTTSLALLKKPAITALPSLPALMTVRITLLDKGTPGPAARIYRPPSTSKPAAEAIPTTNEAVLPDQTQHQSWSSEPPPAQHPPATSTTDSSALSKDLSAHGLRARWLAFDPHPHGQTQSYPRLPKQKTNKFNLPRQQHVYPRESLAKINVLPKHAPQEVIDKFGPNSAFGRGDGEIPKEMPPPPKSAKQKGKGKNDRKDTDAKDNATEPRFKKNNNQRGYLDLDDDEPPPAPMADFQDLLDTSPPEDEWSKHPPCPDVHDLIGFVTSGAYNLSEGRGTAVASIWAQRVLQGWIDHVDDNASEREKRLCIVRNAGESVGRLGVWEVCGG